MDISGNNEAVWVDFGDSASNITGSPSSWIQDYSRLWATTTCTPAYSNYVPDYSNYVRDCNGVLYGSINPVNVWCHGSVGTVTSANKHDGAKAETKKDIGFDAFAEVLEDAL